MLYLHLAPNMEYLVKWCIFEIFLNPSQLKKVFKNLFLQKNNLLHVSDDSESIWAKTKFLNFLVKYSTSAHYGDHTIYLFPKSFDVLH